ncbi:hypothetical protein BR93DRAFT_967435 [Coniochaeta sp. PMI_546]|nr:hypothetical protein BR93DRAFT_967435 [Coniochaeta sp. PMI_546]
MDNHNDASNPDSHSEVTEDFIFLTDEYGGTYYGENWAFRFDRRENRALWHSQPIQLIPTLGIFYCDTQLYVNGTVYEPGSLSDERLAQFVEEAGGAIHEANEEERDLFEPVVVSQKLREALDGIRWVDRLREIVYDHIGYLPSDVTRCSVTLFRRISEETRTLRRLIGGSGRGYVRPLDYDACTVALERLTQEIDRLEAIWLPQPQQSGGNQIASAA